MKLILDYENEKGSNFALADCIYDLCNRSNGEFDPFTIASMIIDQVNLDNRNAFKCVDRYESKGE